MYTIMVRFFAARCLVKPQIYQLNKDIKKPPIHNSSHVVMTSQKFYNLNSFIARWNLILLVLQLVFSYYSVICDIALWVWVLTAKKKKIIPKQFIQHSPDIIFCKPYAQNKTHWLPLRNRDHQWTTYSRSQN